MKPIKIELDEWWYKGCFIQKQNHPQLMPYVVFKDTKKQEHVGVSSTFSYAKFLCEENEVLEPYNGLEAFGFTNKTK